jgi:cobalt/nickel transport system permease protein
MHMADALLSPAVGATMWGATGIATVYCSVKIRRSLDDRMIPLMGVLGAFVFAAQMINFTIPGTGSSGHLGGGLLLAILLGPHAAFLSLASVLFVQALFFADGGLLALGCNIFNLGALPCFIAYPLIYKNIVGRHPTPGRLLTGSLLAGIFGLQLGSLGVVLETTLSGISDLPFLPFLILMQPIHLAIGIGEGLITAGIVSFIWRARPEILNREASAQPLGALPLKPVLLGLALATVLTGGFFSWYASEHPDGLEWAIAKIAGVGQTLEEDRGKTALMPDYNFKKEALGGSSRLGTSVAGLVGGLLVLLLGIFLGLFLKKRAGGGRGQPHSHA